MAKKSRTSPGAVKISKSILAELNDGSREASNLAECLAVDFYELMTNVFPKEPSSTFEPLRAGKPSITQRMKIGGEILAKICADDYDGFIDHSSDTIRGCVAYALGAGEWPSFAKLLQAIRPLANDDHFGVREWAWLAIRHHIVADVAQAIKDLTPWVHEPSPFLRRFAVEATRPRGVWAEHIVELKENPKLGLPLLKPLKADPEKYVQDSVSNWLNDAAKSKPDWVRDLVEGWADGCDDKNTLRICKRSIRSVGPGE